MFEGHEEGDELIGARFDGDLAEASEGASASTQGQEERIAEEECAVVAGLLVGVWRRKGRFGDGFGFEGEVNPGLVVFGAGERSNMEGIDVAAGQDDPFSTASTNQCTGTMGGHGGDLG